MKSGVSQRGLLVIPSLVLLRILDAAATYAIDPALETERNILTLLWGVGWRGLLLSNLALVSLLSLAFTYYLTRHARYLPIRAGFSLRPFAAHYYFGGPGRVYEVFTKPPQSAGLLFVLAGFVATVAAILATALLTLSYALILLEYNYRPIHQRLIEWASLPTLIFLVFFSTYLFFRIEYRVYQNRSLPDAPPDAGRT